MPESCVFCKIVRREIPAEVLGESFDFLAFRDTHPQAPVHALLIPKKHISTIADLSAADAPLAGALIVEATRLARELGISDQGYRLVMNCNQNGGQTVSHAHLHLMGGRRMKWPPG